MKTGTSWRGITKASLCARLIAAASLVAGIGAGGGCGLRLDILEPAPDGGPGRDAVTDTTSDATSPCSEQTSPASGRCEVRSFDCGITSGCPTSWTEAQLPSSCSSGASVVLAGCGGAFSWTSYHEFSVLACYYDAANGALQGFHEEADHLAFCDSSSSSRFVGNVPANCASDGGVYTGGFSCAGDGGLDQPVPCGNTTCAPGQYCRLPNDNLGSACDPTAIDGVGACTPIPTSCGGVATCDCLAGIQPGCGCCVPRGGGVFSCSIN